MWSGLTYRQLEAKAAAAGDVLPSSTIATALGRSTLPREELVAALTKACGLGEADVQRWVTARRKIAMHTTNLRIGELAETSVAAETSGGPSVPADVGSPPGRAQPPLESGAPDQRPGRSFPPPNVIRRLWQPFPLLAGAVVALLLAVGGYLLWERIGGGGRAASPSPDGTASDAGLLLGDAGSFAQIRPAHAPELCVSAGRDERVDYAEPLATLRACTVQAPPRTFLEPVDDRHVFIEWHHPTEGIGCLTLLTDGVARDSLEPWNDCDESRSQQLFRFEPVGATNRFRLRPAYTDGCMGLRDQAAKPGTGVLQGRCTTGPDQEFLVDLLPPA
ncbi:hypothetical protein Pen02_28830 [Plantactinospora endophytica]|uniref:XRE family transcriptional regulator n=1 Tax=Plantactinospora endophytica TaxID=673535 RepID=A0ABQ4E0S8_9ACTN|nr:hypothetical protein Pen02_28830 [Plantactinospora endophytica]